MCYKRNIPLRPKVFFIGTHKDNLESIKADSLIADVDQQLQDVIKSTSHYVELVELASDSQFIFPVNNFSEDETDFRMIRSAVERVVVRDQFQMTSPAHWLIYSLSIRKLKGSVVSYNECFELAKQCGIIDEEELKEALHFIHTKMGLIRYFQYDGVDDIVVVHPQFLFDKVTELIVDTFTFMKAGKWVTDEFKHKGIFSLDQFEKIGAKGDCSITPVQFGKLLEKVRIAAPFKRNGKLHYFFPCVLAHANIRSSNSAPSSVPPLLISFECGFCPKGLPGALIMYLVANELKSSLPAQWELQTDEIFRDEVSFHFGPYDAIVLKILSTHLEVSCIPDLQFDKREDFPVEAVCRCVRNTLLSGIKQVAHEINYIKCQYSLTFACKVHGCVGGHPARLCNSNNRPSSLLCTIVNQLCKLPNNYHMWGLGEIENISQTIPARLSERDHSCLLKQLTKHAAAWKLIGTYLNFHMGELDNIEARPDLRVNGPISFLSAILAQWLQWAPGDSRGSTNFATLEALKLALREAGLGATACDIGLPAP